MRSMTVLGTAIASLLVSTPLAIAQVTPPDGCYVEWEGAVRVDLESLCDQPSPAASPPAVSPSPSSGSENTSSAGAARIVPFPSPITIRIELPPASTVDNSPEALRPRPPSRRYVSYQRFYPHPHLYPHFKGWWFGHFNPQPPLPEVTPPPTRPYSLNPNVPIPRMEERQQQGIRQYGVGDPIR